MPTDATHDPNMQSWVESANDPASDFPIQNLPLCAFERKHDDHAHTHLCTRIGDQVLDLTALGEADYFRDDEDLDELVHMPMWNAYASVPELWPKLRGMLQKFLRSDSPAGQQARRLRQKCLLPAKDVQFAMPIAIFNYTDFYASKHHATNVGSMFRPDNPLLPNYTHVPIGYHGRSSSIIESGRPVFRPNGQFSPPDNEPGAGPSFGPCKMLDYELELGVYIGAGNGLGEPININNVHEHILGMCILNDWSARDIQKWEYQPLGPFLAKNFATSVSSGVVTMAALEPFRIPGPERGPGDPQPLPYLRTDEPWGLDITVSVAIQSAQMRERGLSPMNISTGSFKHMFWTIAQMITHHASNGCNLQPGDLLGSGTISGPEKTSRGCLLERTWDGPPHLGADGKPKARVPIQLPSGESRTFLADGDEVIMTAYCEREGFRRIGFGECRGRIEPAPTI
ncbi:MAG: fumarylacetoacetase [Phycisphaerales bacterium]|nr:fumarylacetoacetase [Phycisphaerales bacterium]